MVGQDTLVVKKGESNQQAFFIELDKKLITEKNTKLEIGIYDNGNLIEKEKTTFNGPVNE